MPAPDPNIEFYDDLADTYHRMYEDWWGFAVHYGQAIATYLAAEGIAPPAEVLDVTCGIGTQALPLAAKGYRVTGSDLSERAVERARREAASRDLDVQFITSDMRQVSEQLVGTFDAVISGANSLTHLLTDDDLMLDLAQIRSCLRPGGVFLATIRDYDKLALDDSQGPAPEHFGKGDERSIVIQAWDWAKDRRTLTTNHVLLLKKQNQDCWDTTVRTTDYRALRRAEFDDALTASSFTDIRWFLPGHKDPQGIAPEDQTGYYQPVVVAKAR